MGKSDGKIRLIENLSQHLLRLSLNISEGQEKRATKYCAASVNPISGERLRNVPGTVPFEFDHAFPLFTRSPPLFFLQAPRSLRLAVGGFFHRALVPCRGLRTSGRAAAATREGHQWP